MTREDEIVAFVKRNGPQWKRDLAKYLRRKCRSKTVLDRPLKIAREKGSLATFPSPPVGPDVIYFVPGTELEALEKWKRKLEYDPHGVHLKDTKVVGIERRVVPGLNNDLYHVLLVEAVGTEPVHSARSEIRVLDGEEVIHFQSGLWDYDDCMPPNPAELSLAVGEVRGIDLFRVTDDRSLIRFPAQQPRSRPGDWKYTEHPFNVRYRVVVTLFIDGQRTELYSKTVGEIMDDAKILARDGKVTTIRGGMPALESGTEAIVIRIPVNDEFRKSPFKTYYDEAR